VRLQQTTPRSAYLPAIDGIRAFAVGVVLLFHAGHLSGGFLGVDAFFVVSGFLITRQMLQEVDTRSRIHLRAFWSRRARRILPAVVLLIVTVILVGHRIGNAAQRITIRDDAPWALGFSLNWHHIAGRADYWASLSTPSPLTHLWSLAVEEQFYVVWPLVMLLLVWRAGATRERRVLIGSGIGAVASFAVMAAVYDPVSTTHAYEGTDARIGALAVGAMCATSVAGAVADRAVVVLGRWLGLVLAAPTLVLAWMWLRVDGRNSWLYHGGFLLHAVLVGVVLLGVASQRNAAPGPTSWLAVALRWRAVRWFGTLSYGLYLWHWPIYIFMDPERTGLSRWPLTAVRIAATVVAAAVSYYVVEQPVRSGLARRPKTRTAFMSAGVIGVGALAIAVVPVPSAKPAPINVSALTPTTLPPTPTSPTTTATVATTTTTTSTTTTPGPTTTTTATTPGPTTTTTVTPVSTTTIPSPTTYPAPSPELHQVLWEGDSIAFTTAPGLVAALQAIGIPMYDGSFPGVGMLNETGPAFFAQVTERVAALKPDLLIEQMSTWDEPFPVEQIVEALGRVRDLVAGVGGHLLLIPPPPMRPDQDHGGFPNVRAAAMQMAAADPDHVTYLDTEPLWGPTFTYDLDGDKVPERLNDGVHLCPAGSARFAIWLITQLMPQYDNLRVADPATWAAGDWTNDPRYTRIPGACALVS
jgi:peptidoglycan/LPS O-acetylase OafA/YrhL